MTHIMRKALLFPKARKTKEIGGRLRDSVGVEEEILDVGKLWNGESEKGELVVLLLENYPEQFSSPVLNNQFRLKI